MTGTNLLITGATGYLGSYLADRFAKEGYKVTPFTGDIAKDVTNEVHSAEPDFILHLAAANEIICSKDLKKALEVNVLGTQNIMQAANCPVIYFSTFHVYGKQRGTITEDTIPEPGHPYGITKLAGEHIARTKKDTTVLRLSNGIGAPPVEVDRWTLLLFDLCKMAHENKELVLKTHGYQRRDFISLEDVYQATRIAMENPGELFNVGAGSSVTIREVAKAVQDTYKEMYGATLPLHAPDGEEQDPLTFSIQRITNKGFNPTTNLQKEIKDTLRYCE